MLAIRSTPGSGPRAGRWLQRSLWALVVALVAAGALAATSPTAAFAITGRTLVTVTSSSTSANKFVTATCPAGKVLVGTGGEIVDGFGNVLITDIVPDAALSSVSVTGGENGAFAGNWQVRAFAMCAPTGSITNLIRVVANASNNGTSDFSKGAVATCTGGRRLFGTGYSTTNAAGNVAVYNLSPDSGLTSVTGGATETNAYGSTWDFTTYAICGDGRTTMTRVSAVSLLDSNPVHGIFTNPCPTGTTLTGVGAYSEVLGGLGSIHMDQLSLDVIIDRVGVNAWEDPKTGYPSLWDEQAFSICVS